MAMVAFLNMCHQGVAGDEGITGSDGVKAFALLHSSSNGHISTSPNVEKNGTKLHANEETLTEDHKSLSLEQSSSVVSKDSVMPFIDKMGQETIIKLGLSDNNTIEEKTLTQKEKIRTPRNPEFYQMIQELYAEIKKEHEEQELMKAEEDEALSQEIRADDLELEKHKVFMGYDRDGPIWGLPASEKFEYSVIEEKIGKSTLNSLVVKRKIPKDDEN